jgi:hypothetical protein
VLNYGQQHYYDNVRGVAATDGYIHLELGGYPYAVHFWRAKGRVKVLLAETGHDLHLLLKEGA